MGTTITPDAIRFAMRRLGLTQQQLADAIGASQGNVSRWLSGESSPRAEHAGALAALIDGAKGLIEVEAETELTAAVEGWTPALRAYERAEAMGYNPLELLWVGSAWRAWCDGTSAAMWTMERVGIAGEREAKLHTTIERMHADGLWPWIK